MGKRGFWVGLLISVTFVLFWLGGMPQAAAFTEDQKVFLQAWRIVNQAYLDEQFNGQNWWLLRQKILRRHFDDREETYQAIEEMLRTLDDPFTRLLRPEQYRSLQVSTSGELSGVGLQIDLNPETHQLEVVAPIAGSPAAAVGIQAGDLILAIDGVPTGNMALDDAAMRMRGKTGTHVSLTVERPGQSGQQTYEIRRDRIELNPVYARLDEETATVPIGYVRLSQFSANATQELKNAIAQLSQQGAQGFILDLRNNPGGLLQAGVDIARLWLNDSTIVYTVNRQGMLDSFDAEHNALTNAPLVVLVNQGTASASEILAGALQDNHRAQLVGEKTFGKGLIQSLFELPDDSGLAVTVAKYETPNHKDIHKLGIMPDQVVHQDPILLDEVGTEVDLQYQAAIQLMAPLLTHGPSPSAPVALSALKQSP
ncbi:carboxyl-terminal processing protease CtpA [Spirulina subsalsa]|uniref:carboxyl-terminal processing protease CtpA n=1 Tax=Spirulina subsalsa TaxID=54311 RepID=UPI0022379FE9|nr:carboxyl-terminal processing protease CtpA [Spirulina subsalsa]